MPEAARLLDPDRRARRRRVRRSDGRRSGRRSRRRCPSDVDRVEFLVKDKVIFVDREPPYECVHDFGEESKAWVIRAVLYHREGFSVSDVIVTRKITIEVVRGGQPRHPLGDGDRSSPTSSSAISRRRASPSSRTASSKPSATSSSRTGRSRWRSSSTAPARCATRCPRSTRPRRAFVETLRPQDQGARHRLRRQGLPAPGADGSDQALLKEAVTSTEALGSTALYDALHAAFRKLRGIEGRKAIVLLSDGDDSVEPVRVRRASSRKPRRRACCIYGIGLGDVQQERPQGVLGDDRRPRVLRRKGERARRGLSQRSPRSCGGSTTSPTRRRTRNGTAASSSSR